MRLGNIKNISYNDRLASQRRHSFLLRIILYFAIALAIFAGLVYFIFFSRFFEIKEISVNGLETIESGAALAKIESYISNGRLNFLGLNKNILFTDLSGLKKNLLAEFPILKSAEINRKFMHSLTVDFKERIAAGVWCFSDGECRYFDSEGAVWGDTAKSSGFLFLVVDDQRKVEGEKIIDKDYFEAIKIISAELGKFINIKNILIPTDSPGDIKVFSDKNCYLIFSLDSDIKGQIEVLKIFLNNKKDDSTFNPQYLDLRVEGRVYYK